MQGLTTVMSIKTVYELQLTGEQSFWMWIRRTEMRYRVVFHQFPHSLLVSCIGGLIPVLSALCKFAQHFSQPTPSNLLRCFSFPVSHIKDDPTAKRFLKTQFIQLSHCQFSLHYPWLPLFISSYPYGTWRLANTFSDSGKFICCLGVSAAHGRDATHRGRNKLRTWWLISSGTY